ncbi:hypothetical protein Hanom_Chr01g00060751 [Helianthus anomalus]
MKNSVCAGHRDENQDLSNPVTSNSFNFVEIPKMVMTVLYSDEDSVDLRFQVEISTMAD